MSNAVQLQLLQPSLQRKADIGCRPLSQTSDGLSDIHKAAYKADVVALRRLLGEGGDVNSKSSIGFTPLHFAVLGSTRLEARSRLAYTQPPNKAAILETVKLLVDAGADVSIVDNSGASALHVACKAGAAPSVVLIILSAASKDHKISQIRNAFVASVQSGNESAALAALPFVLPRLGYSSTTQALEHAPTIDEPVSGRDALLHLAARARMAQLTSALLSLGASPASANGKAATPLHLALGAVYDQPGGPVADHPTAVPTSAVSGDIPSPSERATYACIRSILATARYQDLDRQLLVTADHLKRTSLHWAAICCSAPVVKYLLSSCKWDPETLRARDDCCKTALDYAVDRDEWDMVYGLQAALSAAQGTLESAQPREFKVDGLMVESQHPGDPYHRSATWQPHLELKSTGQLVRMDLPNSESRLETSFGTRNDFRARVSRSGLLGKGIVATPAGLWGGMTIGATVDVHQVDAQLVEDSLHVPAHASHEKHLSTWVTPINAGANAVGVSVTQPEYDCRPAGDDNLFVPSGTVKLVGPYDSANARTAEVEQEARAVAEGVTNEICKPVCEKVRAAAQMVEVRESDVKLLDLVQPPEVDQAEEEGGVGGTAGVRESGVEDGRQTSLW